MDFRQEVYDILLAQKLNSEKLEDPWREADTFSFIEISYGLLSYRLSVDAEGRWHRVEARRGDPIFWDDGPSDLSPIGARSVGVSDCRWLILCEGGVEHSFRQVPLQRSYKLEGFRSPVKAVHSGVFPLDGYGSLITGVVQSTETLFPVHVTAAS